MPEIQYRQNVALDPAQVAEVYLSSGIRRPSDDLPRLQRMLENSNLVISAWHQQKLVGVCRALTDFSYCCYLSDLAVRHEYQQQGVGLGMIDQLRQTIGDEVALILLSAPEAMDYYPKLGFEKVDNGYIIKRKR